MPRSELEKEFDKLRTMMDKHRLEEDELDEIEKVSEKWVIDKKRIPKTKTTTKKKATKK